MIYPYTKNFDVGVYDMPEAVKNDDLRITIYDKTLMPP